MQALEKTMRTQPRAAALQINPAHIGGEPGTGYEGPEGGEFECGNCFFYSNDGGCNQAEMKKFSRRARMADGRVKVDAEGCCEYVKRVGRKDDD